ncbi:MAG: hypothetical protein L0Z53_05750, partial [Acidobacteriales bacterium]|nr:hypothetical protein [Terriglobales bacterium]
PQTIADCLAELRHENSRLLICDAIADEHLSDLARAVVHWPLVTGGSAMGYWLAEAYREAKLIDADRFVPHPPKITGLSAILAGSCSSATCRQVERFKQRKPALALELGSVLNGSAAAAALDWASNRVSNQAVLIHSTMPPDRLRAVQQEYGEIGAAQAVEQTMSKIARGLVDIGVRRLVIAGGETAGAVLQSLGVLGLSIGPQIEPGVPWTESLNKPSLALALKSGNFGSDDFFCRALEMLP